MYSIPIDSVVELQYRFKMASQQCINVFHYTNNVSSTPDGGGVLLGLAESFWLGVGKAIRDKQTTDVSEIEVRAQWVYAARYQPVTYTPPDTTGLGDPPTLSIGTCVVMRKRSERASRSSRGRAFLGGFPVAVATVGEVNPLDVTAFNTDVGGAMLLDLVDAGSGFRARHVIWSYKDPLVKDEVLTCVCDPVLRYQRRREVGRGQ